MNLDNLKCVVITDESISPGIAANISAILGITMGGKLPEIIGSDVADFDGSVHSGIIRFPVPILKCKSEKLRNIREALAASECEDLVYADFSDVAQGCKTYGEFTLKMSNTRESELKYIGIAVCGAAKKINSLTGSLPLFR